MVQKKHWVQRITEAAELHGEALPGVPLVEIAGDNRVLVECHGGVTEYGPEKICIKVRYGHVSILGCGLELAVMTRERLVVCGQIHGVQLNRRGK